MSKFKIGDEITVIDEEVDGVVAFAKADAVKIKTTDGFTFTYLPNELMLKAILPLREVIRIPDKDIVSTVRSVRKIKTNEIVIDLHLHEIVPYSASMSNHEKVITQLEYAKNKFFESKKNRSRSLIFIHGVGTGKLKMELREFLSHQAGINFYDADYRKFGKGATEVQFYKFN